ncbi:MAG: DUF1385 domain-containing protein [Dehalococcoidia bacterium]|nr:MAG: DUF1385 domain-containing protein [Dehalococcoidia bacterium]
MPPSTYGGQAVIEGVMMRGAQAMSVAVRAPSGAIVCREQRLGGIYTNAARRIPLVRGITILLETVVLGSSALTWSAAVAAGEVDTDGTPKGMGPVEWLVVLGAMAFAITVFFVGPVAVTSPLDGRVPAWVVIAVEGGIRMALLLGYVWGIGRTEGVKRVFQYHGAEHMTIAAHEDGRDLTVPAVRRYPKEHPRCGTSFLLTVALVSIVVFAFAGREPLWWRFASRLVLVPFVAAASYEVIRFAGAHQRWPVVRWLFAGNIALQYLTTRPPDDEQIQVALAALDRVKQVEARGG